MSDYYTFITNQDGIRYYLVNYFFFLKIKYSEYQKNFNADPYKFIKKSEKFNVDPENIRNEEFKINQNIIKDDYMIIPLCASFISSLLFFQSYF